MDNTYNKVSKVSHAIGFKTLTYPKGFTLKMKEWNSLEAELVPHDERPQPKPWSGPEDGLPPLGIEFEYSYGGFEWIIGEALYIGNIYAILKSVHGGEQHYYLKNMKFRAIKTAEERESNKRETAIRELMDIAQVDCRVTAARLVDAGFKREVV